MLIQRSALHIAADAAGLRVNGARLRFHEYADRESLLEIMRALRVRVDRLKVAAAWAAEKLGRLKLNGRVLGYSPLSRLVELEALTLGVSGKVALWRALDQFEPDRPELSKTTLDDLIARAQRQLESLEEHRRSAVTDALA